MLSANLQNTYSKTKSFKSCVKRDVNLLTEFDEEPSLIPSNDLFLLTLALDSAQTLSLSETITSFDLISDSPSLSSTRGELHSMLHPTHANFSSPAEKCDASSYVSLSFASKGDLTSCSSSLKINFDPSFSSNYFKL